VRMRDLLSMTPEVMGGKKWVSVARIDR
jgi:hypothetical protein